MVLQTQGLRLGTGTIVDATIIGAHSSTKNAEKKRDPEMHQNRARARLMNAALIRDAGTTNSVGPNLLTDPGSPVCGGLRWAQGVALQSHRFCHEREGQHQFDGSRGSRRNAMPHHLSAPDGRRCGRHRARAVWDLDIPQHLGRTYETPPAVDPSVDP